MNKPSRLAALAFGPIFRTGLLSGSLLLNPVSAQAATTQAADPGPVPAGTVRINYYRPDGKYKDWGLHLWDGAKTPTEWTRPFAQTGQSSYGSYWDVPTATGWTKLNFIVHRGDDKDPGPDMSVTDNKINQVWVVSGQNKVYAQKPDTTQQTVGDVTKAQAFFLTRSLIAVKPSLLENGALLNLYGSQGAALKQTATGVTGGTSLPLIAVDGGMTPALKAKYPYLSGYALVSLRPEEQAQVEGLLRGQLLLTSETPGGKLQDVTGVQIPGVLDDLYAYSGPLGVAWAGGKPTLRLWAPTAQDVKVRVSAPDGTGEQVLALTRGAQGVWTVAGDASWKGRAYVYEVKVYAPSTQKVETNMVSDPYATFLTRDSRRGVLNDLSDAAQKPAGWDTLKKPALNSVSELNFYELHLRDFSAIDVTVPAAQRGTYLAFTQQGSAGMKHLKILAAAGLKAVHLLPTFDIASIPKDRATWKATPDLSKLPPDGEGQQAAVKAVQDQDGYNWGYDPVHYATPEGTYAVNPDERTKEYRQMVMALNNAGLRVVQDVVFNHTASSGEQSNSVLDKVVPGYYQRLNLDGGVENSTCCSNTATEHVMMRKLMIDTVLMYARQYKIDGFRFDLMGHHMVADMAALRKDLDALTMQNDGVDGRNIYVYGEGWDFGEVAKSARGVNATQVNMYGQGIGTFNDRIRDAVRGGNPFGGLQDQGFATGLVTLPNGQKQNTDLSRLLHLTDQLKVGLTGNLRDYKLTDASGKAVTGAQIDYNGAPTGYAASPRESINYASAHDNQTLFDAVVLKAPAGATQAVRVRMQNMAQSLVWLGQGMPFMQAGDELLRSKSFDTDSYNSGDHFNALDWTGADNGFGRGLPPQEKNGGNWPLYRPLLANRALKPSVQDANQAYSHLQELLKIRSSSPLFHMETAAQVQQGLSFLNSGPQQLPGVIVMHLKGSAPYRDIVVVFNASGRAADIKDASLAPLRLSLHPVQAASLDSVVKGSKATGNMLSVPALTTAVFVGK
ncbi:pullulanase-type alpha-1,6-glucosidase [Deinococcus sp.]|uniref:pullulanase-type alpha-1,6-glucosidase n=1 Tax=Deinococcus sp. TaxID=47478 RepID=UPI00286E8529|nr:pullulanase-type alpha-1,6-glucosidase [Deinococcus sp.]